LWKRRRTALLAWTVSTAPPASGEPDGNHVYVASKGDEMAVFSRNSGTGALVRQAITTTRAASTASTTQRHSR
jgi:hypothetical protein